MTDAVFATNSDLCRQLLADGPLTPAELTRQYNKAIKHDRLAHLYPETTSPQEIERSLAYHAERHDWFEKISGKWQVTPTAPVPDKLGVLDRPATERPAHREHLVAWAATIGPPQVEEHHGQLRILGIPVKPIKRWSWHDRESTGPTVDLNSAAKQIVGLAEKHRDNPYWQPLTREKLRSAYQTSIRGDANRHFYAWCMAYGYRPLGKSDAALEARAWAGNQLIFDQAWPLAAPHLPYVADTTGVVRPAKPSKPAQRTTKPGKRDGKGMAGAEGLLLADVPEPGRSRRNRRRVRVCMICGTEFMGRADAMTCSERCRKQKTRAAQRAATTPPVPDTTVVG